MTVKPAAQLAPKTVEFENGPLIAPLGFREYDARWLYPDQINLPGVQALGLGLGTQLHEMGIAPRIVVGHDFRAYSQAIKQALMLGLLRAGCHVLDIGLALSPIAYFAQFALDAPAVAMVTASHNENGWTGVKIGAERPLTHGPDEMARLRDIVLNGESVARDGGRLETVAGVADRWRDDILAGGGLSRRLKAVVACGNGTAGAFAPETLTRLGVDVIPLHTELDWDFPHHNPNPEDLAMLGAVREAVLANGADVGLAFDGDGDRCGVVDNEGEEIFADKMGALLARHLVRDHPGATFVVDVKSTGIFAVDPILKAAGATTDYWKTGHSYIKRRVKALNALAGFEKSGHFFLAGDIGRGYDDGVLTAAVILRMLAAQDGASMADLRRALPQTWSSPTMSPFCPDETKYQVVARITDRIHAMRAAGDAIAGARIADVMTVNGVRVALDDGAWGLVRASSNKPSLVVVVESPNSEAQMRAIFAALDAVIRENPDVGDYDQRL